MHTIHTAQAANKPIILVLAGESLHFVCIRMSIKILSAKYFRNSLNNNREILPARLGGYTAHIVKLIK